MGINFDKFKCRCSSISKILSNNRANPCITDKQAIRLKELEAKEVLTENMKVELADLLVKKDNSTKVILSDTCITYLMEEYAWVTQGMVRVTKEILDVPQMQKGTIVEPQSLLLLNYVDDAEYKPNRDDNGYRERIYNDYLSGEVDAYKGTAIMGAEAIPDIKSIWDYPTFLCAINEPLTLDNDWQVKGYMDISGAPEGFIAKCLVNADEETILKIKWKLLNKMNVATEEATEFKERWSIIEHSLKFDRIPPHQRVHKLPVEPMTNEQETKLYDRVKICREWLNNFHQQRIKLN